MSPFLLLSVVLVHLSSSGSILTHLLHDLIDQVSLLSLSLYIVHVQIRAHLQCEISLYIVCGALYIVRQLLCTEEQVLEEAVKLIELV